MVSRRYAPGELGNFYVFLSTILIVVLVVVVILLALIKKVSFWRARLSKFVVETDS